MILFVKGTPAYERFLRGDRFLAGLIGMRLGDRYSISAQCFRSGCVLCRWLGGVLNLFQRDHLRIAADLEGLLE